MDLKNVPNNCKKKNGAADALLHHQTQSKDFD